jgi:hypothetical protein
MRLWMIIGLAAAAIGTAHAQAYKWVDKNGRVEYGDTPPSGAKVTRLRGVAPAPAQPAASGDPAAAGNGDGQSPQKGPLTPAQQELKFRREMKAAQDAAAKADRERKAAEEKKENCQNAQQALRTLQSGQRIARVDSKGERYFLSDAQRAEETARAQRAVSQWCK